MHPDPVLACVREARMHISEEFNHDPELLVKHYMELQKRHKDRLVYSTEAATANVSTKQAEYP
jgi:hypothetical protein